MVALTDPRSGMQVHSPPAAALLIPPGTNLVEVPTRASDLVQLGGGFRMETSPVLFGTRLNPAAPVSVFSYATWLATGISRGWSPAETISHWGRMKPVEPPLIPTELAGAAPMMEMPPKYS